MYNTISDDIRDDEEVKAELHQRVEDLKEDLWSICDKKKDEAERERELIMNDGWLSDKLGILTNQYITLMQVSTCNRNLATLHFLNKKVCVGL
jgi:hypothetical protein